MKPEPPSGMICTCASFSLGVRISTMQAFINKRFSSSVACRLMQFNFMAALAGNVGFGIGFTARVAKVVISHNNIMALFIYHYTVGSTVHERHIGMSACVNGCQSRNGNSNEHKNGKDNCKNFFSFVVPPFFRNGRNGGCSYKENATENDADKNCLLESPPFL